jgi:hypothetical protein
MLKSIDQLMENIKPLLDTNTDVVFTGTIQYLLEEVQATKSGCQVFWHSAEELILPQEVIDLRNERGLVVVGYLPTRCNLPFREAERYRQCHPGLCGVFFVTCDCFLGSKLPMLNSALEDKIVTNYLVCSDCGGRTTIQEIFNRL